MIQKNFRARFLFVLQMIGVWIIAAFLFAFFRFFGIEEIPNITVEGGVRKTMPLPMIVFVGIFTGIAYGLVEILFERRYFQRISYGRVLLLKFVLYFFIVKILMFMALSGLSRHTLGYMERELVINGVQGRNYWAVLMFFLVVSTIITLGRQINQKFGPGVLWKMIIGKYRHPTQEKRVFMFLDLQSSTTIAEELGHIRYSKLIQDCFFDLTEIIIKHRVDIYQYVGDEAVLSWTFEKGFAQNRCVHAYFDFMSYLESRYPYYQKNYGVSPVFKAGVHYGEVTVAEVGVVKKEIAYHGDVLNTTARIQSRCNALGHKLLVSEALLEALEIDESLVTEMMGEEQLKGKHQMVRIHGVRKV